MTLTLCLTVSQQLSLASNADWMIRAIADLDDKLMAWKVHAQEKWEEMKNHPSVAHLNHRAQLLGHDYRRLMGYMGDRIQKFSVPEQYASAIYNASDAIAGGLTNAMESRQVKKVKDVANEIYQQVWELCRESVLVFSSLPFNTGMYTCKTKQFNHAITCNAALPGVYEGSLFRK